MQAISPFLWFDTQAEEAAELYVGIFDNSRILSVSRYPEGSPYPAGTAMVVDFELEGIEFQAINAGPQFTFSEAISFSVVAETQEKIDYFWNALTADGGEESMCGWLKDKYGLSWQIVPPIMGELLGDSDREAASRTMTAMMTMKKLDIAALQAAHDAA
ncbi:VOC family protein [Subtercola endophyticus]|uniref:VOC family protein n=1 Tax=Subtercola endophyticus TaxID=2895559 RepID=UPI001E2A7020|nr:VOC family protein [Subtercola endophyticus]UFS60576.1 VOC family protein [Subtercola endophyticus]